MIIPRPAYMAGVLQPSRSSNYLPNFKVGDTKFVGSFLVSSNRLFYPSSASPSPFLRTRSVNSSVDRSSLIPSSSELIGIGEHDRCFFPSRGGMGVSARLLSSVSGDKGASVGSPMGSPQDIARRKKEALEDQTLEGRYASSLWRIAESKSLEKKIYDDIINLQNLANTSKDFQKFISMPGIAVDAKTKVIQDLAKKLNLHNITQQFLFVLAENKRLSIFSKISDTFMKICMIVNHEIKCQITTAKVLSASEQKAVVDALQARAGPKAKLIVEYTTSPSMMGGVIVRMGDQVLDFSVSSRLEKIQSQLLQPF